MAPGLLAWEWVIGSWTGDIAKSVRQHAETSLGYFIQQQAGMGPNYTIRAAFRRPIDGPLPEHLQRATYDQSRKLNRLFEARTHSKIEEFFPPAPELTHAGIPQGMYQALPQGDR